MQGIAIAIIMIAYAKFSCIYHKIKKTNGELDQTKVTDTRKNGVTVNVIDIKLCMMVVLAELCPLIPLSVTLIVFQAAAVSNSFNKEN